MGFCPSGFQTVLLESIAMTIAKLFAFCLTLGSIALAHDLYLTREKSEQVCAGIGEAFPTSENAITADRLNSFSVWVQTTRKDLKGAVVAKQFCAAAPSDAAFVAEMTVQPRFIKLKAKDFSGYVHGEGLTNVEATRQQSGQSDAEGRELYSRYSKLLAGRLGDSATKPLGHALEIVPQKDPAELKPGDSLPVVVMFKGKPLADAQVSAVYANAKLKGHEYPVTTRTDAEGRAALKLDRSGLWYARIIYMEPAQNDPEIDWRSYFSTMTFEVPAK